MTEIIRTNLLTKNYGAAEVVSGVNMKVRRGEIYGFLGPNGAGKSTIMKMLLGLVQPTGGEIELFGDKLLPASTEHLKRIGHLIETPIFYEKLSAKQNLELHGEYMGYYNKQAVEEALELVQLIGVHSKPVKQFSLGMKQRLGIARAISTRPDLLLLDEPINGLDPEGIQLMRNLFRRLRDEWGVTLLISSHLLSEIEQVADTIGVINGGRLIREVSMDTVHASTNEYIEIVTSNVTNAAYVLTDKLGIQNFKYLGDRIIRVYDTDISQEKLSKGLVLNDVPIEAINRRHHTLEEYFLGIIRGGE
ncbi:ABC-2 type transport system ATP-binding protein [Paenibacillus algorifonticola]|uniref:ABC-2 type transport system ATP-binding protein n=1 Tax=Paenibacillus algorifonticola TaxID=684063 RepID=A0A1I1YTE7_9BACL|nr:ATP-binding cassette domain-containing protein [Paenibacillus algorifonticola]SFE22612.1 ABC-2 type transport system ATP-binding protein [Paenibacillus algorifonticola]